MYKTKIDWADSSWNPVTGCLHGCEYCYARRHVRRFGFHRLSDGGTHDLSEPFEADYGEQGIKICPYPYDFDPTFHRYRLGIPAKWSEPRTIFVCSMADLFGTWVPDAWIHEVLDACYAAPQHTYLFLTKNPERYGDVVEYLETDVKNYPSDPEWLPGIWLGASATNNQQLDRAYNTSATWLSIEPLREELLTDTNFGADGYPGGHYREWARWLWVVIGAESGNHKDKVIPKREWVMEIVEECRSWGTPIFMKESLRGIMGADFIQEFPWEVKHDA